MSSSRDFAHWGLSCSTRRPETENADDVDDAEGGGGVQTPLIPLPPPLPRPPGPSHSVRTPSRMHSPSRRIFVPGGRHCLLALA